MSTAPAATHRTHAGSAAQPTRLLVPCVPADVSFLRMNSRDAQASAQEKEQASRQLRPEEKRRRLGLADPGQRSRRSPLPPPPAQAMREFLIRQSAAKDEVVTANFIYRSEVSARSLTVTLTTLTLT